MLLSPALRWTTNWISLLSVFFFSGIIYGWAPLELMLLDEGQYSELCNPAHTGQVEVFNESVNDALVVDNTKAMEEDLEWQEGCAEQMNKLNAIFTMAQFFLSFASLPVGFMLDISPKPLHFAIAGAFEIFGLILFSVSKSGSDRDYFILSYSLLALGGCMTMLGAFPASFLLAKYQAAILATISCLFDGSSVIFYVFNILHHNYGFTRKTIFGVWVSVAVVMYTSLIVCWSYLEQTDWRKVIEQEEENETATEEWEEGEALATTKNVNKNDGHDDGTAHQHNRYLDRIKRLGLHSLGVVQQLQTWEYGLALVFASCQMVRCNFFIMVVDDFLGGLGDDNNHFANLFSFILPCGIVFVPVIEWTITSLGVLAVLHLTNGIGLVFGVLLLIPSLQVQLLSFGVFTCFRAYLYATLNIFIAVTFGVRTMGRVMGFVFTTAAVVTLIQYPLSVWTNSNQGGNYVPANTIALFLGMLPVVAILLYERLCSRVDENASANASLNKKKESYGGITRNSPEKRMSFRERQESLLASPGSPHFRSFRSIRQIHEHD